MKLTLVATPVERDGRFFPGFTVTVEDDSLPAIKAALEAVMELYSPPTFVCGD